MDTGWDQLIEEFKTGSTRALSRLITKVENRETGWINAMQKLYPESKNACLIEITGQTRSGKNTLTGKNKIEKICTLRQIQDKAILLDTGLFFENYCVR